MLMTTDTTANDSTAKNEVKTDAYGSVCKPGVSASRQEQLPTFLYTIFLVQMVSNDTDLRRKY